MLPKGSYAAWKEAPSHVVRTVGQVIAITEAAGVEVLRKVVLRYRWC